MALVESLIVGVLNGFVWGTLIALAALGLTLIFGLLEIVNIAHGELYMLGAVGAWFVVQATGSFWLALLIAPLVVGLIGLALERVVIRPVEGDIPLTIIVTFALLLILQQVAKLAFGSSPRSIAPPIEGSVQFAGVSYSAYRLLTAVIALGIMAGLYAFLQYTQYGLWMRGVQQDREMASALGISTERMYMLIFGIGSFFAAAAGVLFAPIVSISFLMGLDILVIAFIVVIVGGLGSLQGALLASVIYAMLENVSGVFVSSVEARLLALVVLTAIALIRPEGILRSEAS